MGNAEGVAGREGRGGERGGEEREEGRREGRGGERGGEEREKILTSIIREEILLYSCLLVPQSDLLSPEFTTRTIYSTKTTIIQTLCCL